MLGELLDSVNPANWTLHIVNGELLLVFLFTHNSKRSGVYGRYRRWW